MTHEVRVLCACDDIENCQLELYVADVRILEAAYQRLSNALESILRVAQLALTI
jgi:hypothetical protein